MRLAFLSIGRHLHTERWVGWFARQGHECHLLTVQPGPVEGVTVHDIRRGGGAKPLRYLRSLGAVKGLLEEIRPELLNTHFLTGYGYWGDWSGFHPNVLTVWGDDVYVTPHEHALKGWLARRAIRNADAVTGDSLDILEGCVALGADPGKCYEVLWGIDASHFRPGRPQRVREELSIPAGAPLLFSPRSFTQPYYNLDVIIEAFVAVQEEHAAAHFVFAGYEGDQGPFERQAQEAGLDPARCRFAGRIPHDQFADYLDACDVFVSVPSVDATAVSLLEAMGCATAVVVSDLPSSTEWVEDGVTGRVVPRRDAGRLARVLGELVADPALRERLGRASRERVVEAADHDRNMRRVEQLYLRLLGQPHDASDLRPFREFTGPR